MDRPQNPIWWEKTVEYHFVIQSDRMCGLNLAMPLSGVEERIGDGVFGADWKIVLVEFKRTRAELDSEHAKFKDYAAAEAALKTDDAHHFLVYGELSGQHGAPTFQLAACTYFGKTPSPVPRGVFAAGITQRQFKPYIKKLAAFKKEDGRSTGTVGPESLSAVIGVSGDGKSCKTVTFSDYCAQALPELFTKPALTPSPRRRTP